jgi:hypothetical protein
VTTRLLVLLVLLTVLPAMGMLWLMNRAVTTGHCYIRTAPPGITCA